MKRAADIFERVVGLHGPARAAALDAACGDAVALRAAVESLLDAHDAAGAFLGGATHRMDEATEPLADAGELPTSDRPPPSSPSRVIGRYKLLESIGEGGFGTVWLAEQREPVKRRVAVKIIKLGMDTQQVIARFEAERQALAMMDHPNIAKVLDGGSTDAGRPYFVMEYIRGVPIVEYCDLERLETPARLQLFNQACNAIQHAHQKGIIHRDIKPSNVMVTLHDGVPVVKVIDFGIAKATNAELTARTLFTQHHQMIGTPAYMSPEQAEMSGLDIDTRSDIYSLGVLLYELLTGTTPFATDVLMGQGFAEMMRIIREEEPHKPSTRLSSLGATATRTAQQRRTNLAKLGTLLRGDLDWIVMKCLEKDRTRRYETANGLAADIRRHLTDEPVVAGPPSAKYRFSKFVRRHRTGVVATTLVTAAIVLGGVGTIAGMLRARSAEAVARASQSVLLETADALWPPYPDDLAMIPALEEWVDAARKSTATLPRFKTKLGEMRERAVAGASKTWSFESPADQAKHDSLVRIVHRLERLGDHHGGLLAADAAVPEHGWSVPKRLAFAQKLAAGFAEGGEYATAWAEAQDAIDEAYHGLDVRPQIGLVPLGADPRSGLWEFAHLLTGEPAKRGANGHLALTEETGVVLVLIPGGSFTRRANTEAHEVVLSPFFMSKFELTQGQWKRLTGRNPSAYGPDAAWNREWLASGRPSSLLHPVEQVSWWDCDTWLRRAGLSLPSEAQWEYATRAGTQTAFWTGDDLDSLRGAANLRDESFRKSKLEHWKSYEDFDDGSAVHWAVGSGFPNAFGLHEVHGNVTEWTGDAYAPYESQAAALVDPVVPVLTDAKYLCRGGGFRTRRGDARSAGGRIFWPPGFSGSGLGVRPAMVLDR